MRCVWCDSGLYIYIYVDAQFSRQDLSFPFLSFFFFFFFFFPVFFFVFLFTRERPKVALIPKISEAREPDKQEVRIEE